MHFKNENDTALRFPVLIGDIGGTNARFAILVDSNAEPKAFPVVWKYLPLPYHRFGLIQDQLR
ncbi:MAG: hypothetical protein RLO12_10305 [Fulvivirga sp.]